MKVERAARPTTSGLSEKKAPIRRFLYHICIICGGWFSYLEGECNSIWECPFCAKEERPDEPDRK